MTGTQAQARALLRESWGKSRSLTAKEYAWLSANFTGNKSATSIEMAIRLAGLWEQYKAADFPTWEKFRAWLKNIKD